MEALPSHVTTFVITHRLKVLKNFDRIIHFQNGEILETVPASASALQRVEPIYEELPGWQQPTSEIRDFEQLPQEAQQYVLRVENLLGVPVDLISVGPEREQAIIVNPVF